VHIERKKVVDVRMGLPLPVRFGAGDIKSGLSKCLSPASDLRSVPHPTLSSTVPSFTSSFVVSSHSPASSSPLSSSVSSSLIPSVSSSRALSTVSSSPSPLCALVPIGPYEGEIPLAIVFSLPVHPVSSSSLALSSLTPSVRDLTIMVEPSAGGGDAVHRPGPGYRILAMRPRCAETDL
jgi:hypothetical protein